MRLVTKELTINATVPYKKMESTYDLVNLFLKKSGIGDYEILSVKIDIRSESESFKIVGPKGNKFIVECQYPCRKFQKMLIADRVIKLNKIIYKSVSALFEYTNSNLSDLIDIEELNRKKGTDLLNL